MDFKSLLFNFQGRIGRGPFWVGALILMGFAILMSILMTAIGSGAMMIVIYLVYMVVAIWAGLAIGIKRCHDRGQSGWLMLITLIPLIGLFWWLINLGLLTGDEGDNRFGSSPQV